MGKYDEIIDQPRHVSKTRKPMSIHDRSAQFMPFAALTGYDESLKETSRITDSMKELSDDEKAIIDFKLKYLMDNKIKSHVEINYFINDEKKDGGEYKTILALIKKVDEINKEIILQDKTRIKISNIRWITSDIFNIFENIE